ncbi:hypothetical protein EXIGLDRAFT_833503 [Exidia glandulosa HHB12029]|uniref:Uncharacterized protein n=1 Tax=Exidia glandulosa HHB12029 TaxID=1314781 RepID=A0A166B010_EXIGL|nr:hypothetical protein EXIGLDRAFT_833503 [Exidia glandulosa HHB12029]
MAHKLADEILRMILTPPLLVPDELFAHAGAVSPFSKATYSAADVLAVCKRWMRVATPALYETVIIRSTAQSKAFGAAIRNNPEFGKFIKRVRVEGAFGDEIGTAMLHSPNVTDFCLTLTIYSDGKPAGLKKAFERINPARVILTLPVVKPPRNAKRDALVAALAKALPTWTNLTAFEFPNEIGWREDPSDSRIAEVLAQCPTLKTVSIWLSHAFNGIPPLVQTIIPNQSVTTIFLRHRRIHGHIQTHMRPQLSAADPNGNRFRFCSIDESGSHDVHPESSPAPSLSEPALPNPFYRPMPSAPEPLQHEIWGRILEYAVQLETHGSSGCTLSRQTSWVDNQRWNALFAQDLMCVSWMFRKLLQPVLIKHVYLRRESDTLALLQLLAERAELASLITTARVLRYALNGGVGENVSKLLRLATGLERCTLADVSDSLLVALGSSAGHRLRHLQVACSTSSLAALSTSASSFDSFRALTSLSWSSFATVIGRPSTTSQLSSLRTLEVQDVTKPFFAYITALDLPDLSTVKLGSAKAVQYGAIFLRRHGGKVTRLESSPPLGDDSLSSCPALEVLHLQSGIVDPALFPGVQLPKLREIHVYWSTLTKPANMASWRRVMSMLTVSAFPSLKDFKLLGHWDVWPRTERDIKKSPWPAFAEMLAQRGVTLADRTGQTWRPRL